MRRSLKICSVLLLSLAIVSMPMFFVGCASQGAATVRQAEKLIAQHPAQLPAVGSPPAEGPAESMLATTSFHLKPADTSRKHLLELYAGQQEIITALEGNAGSRSTRDVPFAGPGEEGPPSDLPRNISQDDLLRILAQQQKLIKALTNRNVKHAGRPTTGR
jgi:hypothetical protein